MFVWRPHLGSATYPGQIISATRCSLKAAPLNTVPTVKMVGRAHIQVQDRGSLRLPVASSSVDHPAIASPCPLPTITCHFLNTSEVFSFLCWPHQLIKTITLMEGKKWGRDHCFLRFKENLESCLYLYHRLFNPDDFQRYTSIFPPHGYTTITITAVTR